MIVPSGYKRRGRRGSYQPLSDINITPFVDVMLVLLIVFMVTAPLMTVGVPVDLPETKASSLNEPTEPLVLTLTAKGVVYLQETPIKIGQLISKLKAITKQNYNTTIYIRGDRAISYGHVMHLLGLVNGAGFTKVALLSNSTGDPR